MANDSKQYQEEEYLFSEDDHMDPLNPGEPSVEMPEQSTSGAGTESFFKTWRKSILIGLGLLLVVFIVYRIISVFFVSNEPKQIPSIPTQQAIQPVSASLTQTTSVSSPETSLHEAVNGYNQNRQEEQQQINQLSATVQNISAEVSDLQSTSQNLQASMNTINDQLSQINTALATVTNQMQIQENRWKQQRRKAEIKRVTPRPVVQRASYQTMAVIPGRAWLKSSGGATITVHVGSRIPGYGSVTSIETGTGKIMTSSGAIIQYAPNDE